MGCDVCIGFNDGDYAEFYEAITLKARKEHRCCECRMAIPKGASYEHVRMVYEGEWSVCKTCSLCVEIRDVFSCGENINHTELWREMRECGFPHLTTASECFTKLSAAAKARVLEEWQKWKGLAA